jgi:hypothetical protein
MSKLKLSDVRELLAVYRGQLEFDGDDLAFLHAACSALKALKWAAMPQDPNQAWDQLRAQLWGARGGCPEAWQKMADSLPGINRQAMADNVQVAMHEDRLRVNFSREFYLNHRGACHATIGYWVAAARHLGHTSRPGKRDDGSGYVEFSLEPSSD